MAKQKMISVNAWEKIAKETYTNEVHVEWHGNDLVIKRTLTLEEMLGFVRDVMDACFTPTEKKYLPEIMDFAIMNATVGYYSNVSMPSNISSRYDLLYRTDLVGTICAQTDPNQYDAMISAIREKLRHTARANISEETHKLDQLYSQLNAFGDSMSAMFEGVDPEDIKSLVGTLANGTADEDKLVQAMVNKMSEDETEDSPSVAIEKEREE